MPEHYYEEYIDNVEDSRGNESNSNSDDETNEPLDYQDWSTIYSDELWDMWYSMKEYLDNRYTYDGLMENVEPDDFFYDFCFEYPQHFERTLQFQQWEETHRVEIKYLWRMIKDYKHIFGSKTYDDFCYFLYTSSKKSKQKIYNDPRYNFCESSDSRISIPSLDSWFYSVD